MNLDHFKTKALQLDKSDALAEFRRLFLFPRHQNRKVIYLTGNSLGLQPITARNALLQELDDWAVHGVEGHFKAKHPWYAYHEMFVAPMSHLIGGLPDEVVVMNGLTTNLHLLMATFYRPNKQRYKILCESKAFPSDRYALETQIRHHGLNVEDTLIEIGPREGEYIVDERDILAAIADHRDQLALVMMGGVNYYTGQVFDIARITRASHDAGALCGWDLAHAVGNIPLKLHGDTVDFAAWCSYKYLNAGPGSVSGVFIHQKHAQNTTLPRLGGWWGHDKTTRFKMEPNFKPMPSAEGWQLSNAPVFAMAPLKASLDIFIQAGGMEPLRRKSIALSAWLREVLAAVAQTTGVQLKVITPSSSERCGAQVSVLVEGISGKSLFDRLSENGVVADWREPNVIRMAPVPLYNNFEDIYRFMEILHDGVLTIKEGKYAE
jgi:kynureninase